MVSKKVIIKSLVCTALTCSFATCALAADKDNGEKVQSSWMDRTDIGIGFKGSQEDSYHDYAMPNKQMTDNNLSYDTRFHYRNHNSKQKVNVQYFIETLQPIKQYGKDGKSVVFVQGRLDGNGGEKISTSAYWNGPDAYGSLADVQQYYIDKGEEVKHDNLGLVGTAGVGYRRLSTHEHAYVGANVFYDYAFKDKFSRVSAGLEYVAGLNTISVNVYRGLSEKKVGPYQFNTPLRQVPRAIDFHDSLSTPPDGIHSTPRYSYEHVLDGFDIRYTRDYKNARWLSSYVEGYHWKTKAPGEQPTEMFYIDQHKWQSIHGLKVGAKMNVTPHISVDLGLGKSNISSVEPYVSVMYTLGKSRYAYFGGKHSENVMTTARSKVFDKVKRGDMKVEYYWEQDLRDGPWDHL
ncbi:inverse autotransporter beta domain-containing protein [uncultured Veillonella sp.]|uniref:inverse autotransporter beta domain-containing protein n=1 Tax=uncultured Veillonella sp. TaxID=159268 RepID=UPI0025FE7993|nr:inverse autotransporter beta domain-containing protein [uncultured Veillonella sp.]